MKKNLTKKALLPALAMALASVIALSGVTYAWFTVGTTASVGSLDVNVQTANGIQVSLDAASWKSVISADDIKAAITDATAYSGRVIQLPEGEIAPVSSAGNIDANGRMEIFDGGYTEGGNLYSTKAEDSNGVLTGNYVAFDLFFKSSMEQTLSLKRGADESYVISTFEGASDPGTATAVRVAFLNLGNSADPSTARNLKGNGGKALIWEPNSTVRAPGSEGAAGQVIAYSGFAKAFSEVAADSLGSNVEEVTTFDSDAELVQLKAGITKVRIYIWLEGQDVDCINNISFGDFQVNLSFTVPEVTTEG